MTEIRVNLYSDVINNVSEPSVVWNDWGDMGTDLLDTNGVNTGIQFSFPGDTVFFTSSTEGGETNATGDAAWIMDGGAVGSQRRTPTAELSTSMYMRVTGLTDGVAYAIEFVPLRSSGSGGARILKVSIDTDFATFSSQEAVGNTSETLKVLFTASGTEQDIFIGDDGLSAPVQAFRIIVQEDLFVPGIPATTITQADGSPLASTPVTRTVTLADTQIFTGLVSTDAQGVLPALDLSETVVEVDDVLVDRIEFTGTPPHMSAIEFTVAAVDIGGE